MAQHIWGNDDKSGSAVSIAVNIPAQTGLDSRNDISGGDAGQDTHPEEADSDFAGILLSLVIILLAAKIGGDLCERIGQPAVLGELLLGVILGNFYLTGFGGFEQIKHHLSIEVLAEIGVIILLFQVGLETNLQEMKRVGVIAFIVGMLGVILPFFLGWGVAAIFLPEATVYVYIFVGACLTATSVGITARVFQDLGRLQDKEARIVLGAAVIDDVLGLVVLSIVAGIDSAAAHGGGGISGMGIFMIILKAFVFLFGAVIIGGWVAPRLFKIASRMRGSGLLISFSLMFCFVMAYLSKIIGLAPIVGAFSAGLILEEVHFYDFSGKGEHQLEDLLKPIAAFLVPIFFVYMGMRVDMTSFGNTAILGFALALTAVAIIGKQACSLGVIFEKGINKIIIGLGMIPRGEVGLIAASIGAKLKINGIPVIDRDTFSAVVIVVILTTLFTPPVLKYALAKNKSDK
ncbi:MAG: cation:proton antiporter [candidate division Zixibacteria bacterium]|nr:cation:proton antiporter [candidate division Zixibacteria bacterium]